MRSATVCQHIMLVNTLYSEVVMKIILVRSPGFLAPILRKIFGIKKEKKKR
ncbi:MAG: stage V sporulation protein SpoVM [Ruminococcaceae bacterium]|nr:stage V sporulation protein SpoVM [Oscillospiraceae bacterium]